ncbi:MAG: hypothetical protein WA397_32115 [Roseiarcus sp.]
MGATGRRLVNALKSFLCRSRNAFAQPGFDTQPPHGPYAARPLYGICAPPPYDGSVPMLYRLLLPLGQRPKTFALGARECDPVKLGFVIDTAWNSPTRPPWLSWNTLRPTDV